MRIKKILALICALFIFNFILSSESLMGDTTEIPGFYLPRIEKNLARHINEKRGENKLLPLTKGLSLTDGACTLCKEMFDGEYFLMARSDGADWRTLVPGTIKNCAIYGTYGYDHERPTAEKLFETIMEAQTGQDMILGNFNFIGIAVFGATHEGDWLWFCIIICANIPEEELESVDA